MVKKILIFILCIVFIMTVILLICASYKFNIIPQKYQSTTLIRIKNNNTFAVSGTANLTSNLGININSMQVNNDIKSQNNESIMVLNIPCEVSSDVLNKLNQIDGVKSSKYVKLSV